MDINKSKPKSDLKLYRLLELDNGLEILLISTSKLAESRKTDGAQISHKAAAAMFVSVGSFADPLEAEGCAHFLEHMIFMGVDSPKYDSAENLYDSFVSSHGGSCNAFTEGEYTVYQFDIAQEHFTKGLDIFACCFKSPLLSFSASDREIKSIDSEFSLAKTSDGTRLQQLMCDAAKDGHVLRKFSWGNMNSLSTVPKAKNIDMHSILKGFYDKHYVPSNSKLVVLSPQSLDELERDARDSFGDWVVLPVPPSNKDAKGKRKRDTKKEPFKLLSLEESIEPFRGMSPFPSEGSFIARIIPVKKTHKLLFTWSLPSAVAAYKTKPGCYISHLIGHEGAGSLLSCLKASGLATGVSAGMQSGNMESNSMFSLFAITVYLTTKGLSNWILVTEKVFEYIRMLQVSPPQKWIFDEIQKVADIDYNFLDEEEESDFVERLCLEMAPSHKRDRNDLLSASFLYWEWDPTTVTSDLALMTPAACRFELLSSAFVYKDESKEGGKGEGDVQDKKGGKGIKSKGGKEDEDDSGDDDEDDGDDDEDDDDNDDDDEEENDEDDGSDDDEDSDEEKEDTNDNEDLSSKRIESLYIGNPEWKDLCALPAPTPSLVEGSLQPAPAPSKEPSKLSKKASKESSKG
jgi:nardilysin